LNDGHETAQRLAAPIERDEGKEAMLDLVPLAAAIREAAEREGYQVEGFAPTSRAAYQLEEAGIPSMTLQHHLAKGEQAHDGGRHLYFVDESSLASTKQMHEFFLFGAMRTSTAES
jgi:hypothetical protein